MDKKSNKKPWVRPAVKRLEPTDALLTLFAALAEEQAVPSNNRMK
jgi:hypothetical protein